MTGKSMTVKPLTVQGLIDVLKKYDPRLPVAYCCMSEKVLLEADELEVEELCIPRPDGWVANKRPDKDAIPYLVFPGN